MTIRTKPNACLSCGYLFDSITDPTGDKHPKAGDISMCFRCGHLMAFNADLTVRPLSDDEMREIAGDKELLRIQEARSKIYDR